MNKELPVVKEVFFLSPPGDTRTLRLGSITAEEKKLGMTNVTVLSLVSMWVSILVASPSKIAFLANLTNKCCTSIKYISGGGGREREKEKEKEKKKKKRYFFAFRGRDLKNSVIYLSKISSTSIITGLTYLRS